MITFSICFELFPGGLGSPFGSASTWHVFLHLWLRLSVEAFDPRKGHRRSLRANVGAAKSFARGEARPLIQFLFLESLKDKELPNFRKLQP